MFASSRMYLFAKCQEVENSPRRSENQVRPLIHNYHVQIPINIKLLAESVNKTHIISVANFCLLNLLFLYYF